MIKIAILFFILAFPLYALEPFEQSKAAKLFFAAPPDDEVAEERVLCGIKVEIEGELYNKILSLGLLQAVGNTCLDAEVSKKTNLYELLQKMGSPEAENVKANFLSLNSNYNESDQIKLVKVGSKIVNEGILPRSPEKRQSQFFKCINCHSTKNEWAHFSRKWQDPNQGVHLGEVKAAYATQNNEQFKQGASFKGIVTRMSYYNDDYSRVYGAPYSEVGSDLRQAIQVCSTTCSKGEELTKYEIDAIMAYFESLQFNLEDILTEEELCALNMKLQDSSQENAKKKEVLSFLHDKYPKVLKETFVDPAESEENIKQLTGNPDRGKQAFERSCLSCHSKDVIEKTGIMKGFLELEFGDNARTYKYLVNSMRKPPMGGPSKFIKAIRAGIHPSMRLNQSYMPLYTKENLSDQQIADIISYIKNRNINVQD